MSHGEETAKRRFWRPRFGLRTLAILVTLVCAYFGAWETTKKYGVTKMDMKYIELPMSGRLDGDVVRFASSPCPLVIVCNEIPATFSFRGEPGERMSPFKMITPGRGQRRIYY